MKTFEEYYYPTIEEFHIGFEYERNDGGDWYKKTCDAYDLMDVKTKLNRFIVKDGFIMAYYLANPKQLEEAIKTTRMPDIRVRYLDYEQLEKIGFKKTDQKDPFTGELMYSKTEEEGFNTGVTESMTRYNNDTWLCIREEYGSWANGSKTMLQLQIKNMSEFNKLMKQIL